MFGIVVLATAAAQALPTPAVAAEIMRLWCTQTGRWRGSIEVVAADATRRTATLTSDHNCSADGRMHLVNEAFDFPGTPVDATAKLTYSPKSAPTEFTTAYFAKSTEAHHRYQAVEARATDDRHWTTTIESAEAGDVFEGRPATTRYTRAMNGDVLESRKEVKRSDETGFVTRSQIVQKREPAR